MDLNFPCGIPLVGHMDSVLDLSFSKVCDSGFYLASVGRDGRGIVRRGDTGEKFRTLLGHQSAVRGVSVSENATIVATGSDDCTARIWSVSSGLELTKFRHTQMVSSLALDTGSERMLTSSQERASKICLYDVNQSKEVLCVYQKKLKGVRNVIFCRDDRSFLASSYDRNIQLWDILSGLRSHKISLPHHAKSMELCADGKTVTIGYGKSVVFFDADTFNIHGHHKMPFKVMGASLHPQKKSFVCASLEGKILKFNYDTGEEEDRFRAQLQMGHNISGIKYSPDGEMYVSSSTDGQITLWSQSSGNRNSDEDSIASYSSDTRDDLLDEVDGQSEEEDYD
ncbi:serine-threonine kinase receptor-associated protein [Drosophila miranda]|uniref:serine-threonine kinase receptor-associated protein n=1 Tax=Drosophila miranda TaxID=7229 RepID=UPI0007E85133|nr:serine-threonine kinase receptor-associated protein [Drosophila miranda]